MEAKIIHSNFKAFFLGILLVLAIGLFLFTDGPTFGWTNPTGNPPTATSTIFYSGGNVGIGTSSPAYTLDVVGDINATGNIKEGSSNILGTTTIMYFNLASCPTGWTEYTAARGRYVVGLPSGGTLAATVGTALTNSENRVVGPHTHTNSLSISAHDHTVSYVAEWGAADAADSGVTRRPIHNDEQLDSVGRPDVDGFSLSAVSEGLSITNASTGTISGTNAPYVQFLVCQKS